ncbi:hypothetical protein GE061_003415 [Apolygus lucorum]|uniref:Uncharacterized protein n=1 Tax=Apolygus lucorum TaxID=248454 RepID=A0A8S9X241_APOLU|nr:hypothetical protein GE061_003415 [Apolygus lucorum]
MGKNVSLESVENRLSTFYDFEAANGIVDENLIFNHELDFALPEQDFPEVTSISKERESLGGKKSSRSSSAENPKTPVSKFSKKPEPKTSEKKKIEDDKKTPAKKRGRASDRSTPVR